MATAGLSIFGFYPPDVAGQYLTNVCHAEDTSPGALQAAWEKARTRLSKPDGNAGNPTVGKLPEDCASYVAQLMVHPWMALFQADFAGTCEVRLVEIRPLLAIQPHVERKQCASAHDLKGATAKQLLERCLPFEPPQRQVNWEADETGRGLIIRHSDFNLQTFGGTGGKTAEGALMVGPVIGVGAPWSQAIEIDGKVYLRNGYHRAVGLMEAGHSRMPCLFFKGHRNQLRNSFSDELAQSADPPTVGHFESGRATEVQLRKGTKIIAINWTEYVVQEKD